MDEHLTKFFEEGKVKDVKGLIDCRIEDSSVDDDSFDENYRYNCLAVYF